MDFWERNRYLYMWLNYFFLENLEKNHLRSSFDSDMPDLIGVILRASASACQFCCWVYALQSEPKALLQGLVLAKDDDGF